MGGASCKNTKSHPETQQRNITIGIFGLDDAGKTSTVRAIEGDPTDEVEPTVGSYSKMIPFPMNEKTDNTKENKNQQRIRIIDVSGERKFRQNSWFRFYDEIHGLIFVIDASDKSRFKENQEVLEDLLENDKLKTKPILILANKKDLRDALINESDLKRRLNVEKLKVKHKIELCTALPQRNKNPVDESLRKGFAWLIRTIEENYTELNSLRLKTKTSQINRRFNQHDSDDDSDDKYSKAKTNNYTNKNTNKPSKITNEKLPNIITSKNKLKAYSDDDEDDDDDDDVKSSSINDYNKKRKLTGATRNNDTFTKRSSSTEPKAYRSTYEPFPEEMPWSISSNLKKTLSDDMLPKFSTKTSLTSDARRRNMSPLVHDTKPLGYGSLSKRDTNSDDDDIYKQQKSKLTNRFENANLSSNKFSSPTKKTSSTFYDDDDDDDDKIKNRFSSSQSNSRYDNDDNYKSYQRASDRLNLDSNYRGASAKATTTRSKYDNDDDDDDRRFSSSGKKANSKYDDDDDDDNSYSKSRLNSRSPYNNDNTKSKLTNRSHFNDDDDDDYNYKSSSSKQINHSKYDDENRSYSSSKPISTSKFQDDDYPKPSSRTNYPSSYSKNNYGGSGSTRSRFGNDDFFTSKDDSNSSNRFQKRTNYDN